VNKDVIIFDDEYFMRRALSLAETAAEEGETPVGALAVKNGRIIAKAYNQTEKLKDATAHAEILVITQVAAALGDWRLNDVDIYVTKEPCAMCAGAMVNSRIRRLIFGVSDSKCGCAGSVFNLAAIPGFPHKFEIKSGVLEKECKKILQDFFKKLRKNSKMERISPSILKIKRSARSD
jgi:tRNA(adenine34) deaminase